MSRNRNNHQRGIDHLIDQSYSLLGQNVIMVGRRKIGIIYAAFIITLIGSIATLALLRISDSIPQ
jgi:hypothetical protein